MFAMGCAHNHRHYRMLKGPCDVSSSLATPSSRAYSILIACLAGCAMMHCRVEVGNVLLFHTVRPSRPRDPGNVNSWHFEVWVVWGRSRSGQSCLARALIPERYQYH